MHFRNLFVRAIFEDQPLASSRSDDLTLVHVFCGLTAAAGGLCIWIDTLHFEKYPKHPKVALACDQWHIIRSKFLAVLGEVHIKC